MGRASISICSLVALLLCIINIWMHAMLAWNFGLQILQFFQKTLTPINVTRQHSIC